MALGATQWQTIWRQVLPAAIPGIATGVILALSRAIGETAPLIVVGAATVIAFNPSGLDSQFTALPIQIFDWISPAVQRRQRLQAARGGGDPVAHDHAARNEQRRDLASKPIRAEVVGDLEWEPVTEPQDSRRNRSAAWAGASAARRRADAAPPAAARTAPARPRARRLRAGGRPGLLRRQARGARRQLRHRQERDHRADRPVGLRQVHADPLPQPHERPDPERPRRGQGALPRPGPLRPGGRPGRGAQADRHGVPEAEPVPQVDLRQHRLRPARARHEGRHGRDRRARAHAARAVGRGQGPPQDQRVRHVGRPAAAPLHRPLPGGRARRDPDGRALLGARPDLDRQDRGPDDGAEARLLDRDRHPQHAAGGARVGQDGVLHRRARRRRAPRGRVVEFDDTEKIFTNPSDPRTEAYVTGKVG